MNMKALNILSNFINQWIHIFDSYPQENGSIMVSWCPFMYPYRQKPKPQLILVLQEHLVIFSEHKSMGGHANCYKAIYSHSYLPQEAVRRQFLISSLILRRQETFCPMFLKIELGNIKSLSCCLDLVPSKKVPHNLCCNLLAPFFLLSFLMCETKITGCWYLWLSFIYYLCK